MSAIDESPVDDGFHLSGWQRRMFVASQIGAALLLALILSTMLFCSFVLPRSLVLNSIFDISKPRTLVEYDQIVIGKQRDLTAIAVEREQNKTLLADLNSRTKKFSDEFSMIKDQPVPTYDTGLTASLLMGPNAQEKIATIQAQNTQNLEHRNSLLKMVDETNIQSHRVSSSIEASEDRKRAIEASIEETQKEAKPERDRYLLSVDEDTDHIYLVLRAISLGGIGAFASFMAQVAASRPSQRRFRPRYAVMFAALLVGAIVAIAVIGILFTKQLTIFEPTEAHLGKIPDFWRVTIVCLIAGAFADRIFAATTHRVDRYLGEETGPPPGSGSGG